MIALIAAFLITAFLYALVGFGGGSTYNALLVLSETNYQLLPTVALSCNIIVVAGGAWHFARSGRVAWPRLLPFVCLSIPMALIGGQLPVSERAFVGLLGITLLLSAFGMLLRSDEPERSVRGRSDKQMWYVGVPLGGAIGLLAGIVGIGGGIFLAPLLHMLHWGSARAIAAASSVFILVNSVAGLSGQLIKLGDLQRIGELGEFVWLFPAVLIGGQLGSRLGAGRLPGRSIRLLTAILVFYVSLRLLHRWYLIV